MHEIQSSITERVDDISLLLAQMQRMGRPALLDAHCPTHGNWQGLSWGWVPTIWLSSLWSTSASSALWPVVMRVQRVMLTSSLTYGPIIVPFFPVVWLLTLKFY